MPGSSEFFRGRGTGESHYGRNCLAAQRKKSSELLSF